MYVYISMYVYYISMYKLFIRASIISHLHYLQSIYHFLFNFLDNIKVRVVRTCMIFEKLWVYF